MQGETFHAGPKLHRAGLRHMLVLGDQELQNGSLSVRSRKQGNQGALSREEFLARIRHAIESRQAEG